MKPRIGFLKYLFGSSVFDTTKEVAWEVFYARNLKNNEYMEVNYMPPLLFPDEFMSVQEYLTKDSFYAKEGKNIGQFCVERIFDSSIFTVYELSTGTNESTLRYYLVFDNSALRAFLLKLDRKAIAIEILKTLNIADEEILKKLEIRKKCFSENSKT